MSSSLQELLDEALRRAEAPAGAAVDLILQHAVRTQASDIHLDPATEGMHFRCRLDGVLHEQARIPKAWQARVIARLKVLAGLLTYREDIPQEGRIAGYPRPESPSIRVSVYPTLHGEKATLRVFLQRTSVLELEQLGFDPATLARMEDLLRRPQGMLLLTGPSGSGKTTTIYAALKAMNRRSLRARSIVTIEDPIEAPLDGVVQTQLNRSAGLDFQGALRTLLRHDPEVIVIGEIRDRETAEIAIEAGLTGHFIISTIHSGRAVGVFHRLLELGIEPYLITSAVSAVLAQRLLRTLCPDCGPAPRAECPRCGGIGYQGRTVLYEFVPVEGPIRSAILGRRDLETYLRAMGEMGCETLLECAHRAVAERTTKPEEVARVLA